MDMMPAKSMNMKPKMAFVKRKKKAVPESSEKKEPVKDVEVPDLDDKPVMQKKLAFKKRKK